MEVHTCCICQDEISADELETTSCNHHYHKNCFVKMVTRKPECAICRKAIIRIKPELVSAVDEESKIIHTKLYESFTQLSVEFIEKQIKYTLAQRELVQLRRQILRLERDLTTNDIIKAQELAGDMRKIFSLRKNLSLNEPAEDPREVELWNHI